MATNHSILFLAGILVFITGCNISSPDLSGVKQNVLPMSAPPEKKELIEEGSSQKRQRLAAIYTAEIGTREKGGNNKGARIGEYLASTGLKQGHPWCAAFTKWSFTQSNIPTQEATAWSPSWFPSSKVIWKKGQDPKVIQQADLFGLHYANLGRIGHVGFVDEIHSDYIITVEGNTSDGGSREGDSVQRRRRLLRTITKVSNWID